MKPINVILPGILSIGWIDCRNLIPNVTLRGICRMDVPVLTKVSLIDFTDAKCSNKSEFVNNGYKEVSTLSFYSTTDISGLPIPGFVVTDVNGNSFLIGSKESPHPIVNVTQSAGEPGDEPAGFKYEITWNTIKGLIPCLT